MISSALTATECRPYNLQRVARVELESLNKFFDTLPLDPYLKQKYRYRRFSRFRIVRDDLVHLPHQPFVQTSEYNVLLGGVVREYLELDADLTSTESFKRIVRHFVDDCRSLPDGSEVGVHQIRIISQRDLVGRPSPEGVHIDGFDFVGIFCVDRRDINGGETYLYESKDGEPVYRTMLEPGDMLVFDDRQMYHYTAPIFTDSEQGWRDVFILTAAANGN
jgi:hypothetical protein